MNGGAPTGAAFPGTRPEGVEEQTLAAGRVREMFGRIAPRYDLLNHLLSLGMDIAWRRRTASRFRGVLQRPDAQVLDLCCGTGDMALTLAQIAGESGAHIVGADFVHGMVARAGAKASKGSAPRTEFMEADALALPFGDETFDLVTAAFGFRNLANYAAGIGEILRILRPSGTAAILEFAEPRGALIGHLTSIYFHRVLPAIGGLISGDRQAYRYLPASVSHYPAPEVVAELMNRAGFSAVTYERWMGGLVTLHTGNR